MFQLAAVLDLDHTPVLDHGDILRRDTERFRQLAVQFEHAQLAMHRDEELGLGQVDQQFHLLLAGMPGDMHGCGFAVDHIGAPLVQAVDDVVDRFFIARDGGCR